jgi:exosortase/archaeosortase family protein
MFPTTLSKKILTPVMAVFLAFIVNGFRVALMAVLAHSNEAAFKYWHEGDGSLIFSMLAVLIFGFFCHFLLLRNESENQDSMEA